MRILLITDRYPYPLTNGQNLRVFNIAKLLSKNHAISIACFANGNMASQAPELFVKTNTFERDSVNNGGFFAKILSALDVNQVEAESVSMKSFIERADSSGKYDILLICGWNVVKNIPSNRKLPLVIDAIDDSVLELERSISVSTSLFDKVKLTKRYYLMRAFEKKYIDSADKVIFAAEPDSETFNKISIKNTSVYIHNGVDFEYFSPDEKYGTEENLMIFEGSMDHAPNEDGMVYFHDVIFPMILVEEPTAKLKIVGKYPSSKITQFASDNVEITGRVDDIRPHVRSGSVFVCPLRIGSGIKNKILQAWSMEMPVVATSASVGGLHVNDGYNIVICDDPKEFAKVTISLLRDKDKRKQLGVSGRKTVIESYGWGAKAQEFENILHQVTRRTPSIQ